MAKAYDDEGSPSEALTDRFCSIFRSWYLYSENPAYVRNICLTYRYNISYLSS